jgi:hypothetical protein
MASVPLPLDGGGLGWGRSEEGHYARISPSLAFPATIIPQTGTIEFKDTCRPRLNAKKPMSCDQEQFQWRLERDQFGVKLCLTTPNRSAAC